MSDALLVALVVLLVLPMVALLAFTGCGRLLLPDADEPAPGPAQDGDKDKETPPPGNGTTVVVTPPPPPPYKDVVGAHRSLKAWWRLGDAAGSALAKDSSTVPHDGRANGVEFGIGGALQPKDTDTAARFAGNEFVEIDMAPELELPQSFTAEAWVQLEGQPSNQSETVFSSADEGGGMRRGFELRVMRAAAPSLVVRTGAGIAGQQQWDEMSTTLPASGWSHVALTYDGPTTSAILYINGAQALTDPAVAYGANTTQRLYIGADARRQGGELFRGLIDEVALYNVALDPGEIKLHFDAGTAT